MKLNKETVDKFIELYATGKQSIQDICEAVGIDRSTFYAWKKNKAFGKKLSDAHTKRLDAIGEMALSGMVILLSKHEYEEVTVEYIEDKNGKPKIKSQKKVKKFIMPNPAMVALALTNRQAVDWKNKQSIDTTVTHNNPLIIDWSDDGKSDTAPEAAAE